MRPVDKRNRAPSAGDADCKGRVLVWVSDKWVKVDWHSAATFKGVRYWMKNQQTQRGF